MPTRFTTLRRKLDAPVDHVEPPKPGVTPHDKPPIKSWADPGGKSSRSPQAGP
ncbi:hypothetical protein [Actinomadura sp. 6N118]|uniref:hypothetical protein n=1 Tax=Actinomadura sp. 6N118 TaxID=3375151 RepID=UPI0037A10C38